MTRQISIIQKWNFDFKIRLALNTTIDRRMNQKVSFQVANRENKFTASLKQVENFAW